MFHRWAIALPLLIACTGLVSPASAQSRTFETDRFGFDGSAVRYNTLADAQNGTNPVGAPIVLQNRDVSFFVTQDRDPLDPLWPFPDTVWISTVYWYTTDANTNGLPKDHPDGDRYHNGFYRGLAPNTGVGAFELVDQSAASSTMTMGFAGFNGSVWTEYNLSLSGANLDDANTWAANFAFLTTQPRPGNFRTYTLNITATGLNGTVVSPGVVSATNVPTGVTGTFTGIFEDTGTNPSFRGFYKFTLTFDMDNWAFSVGNAALNGDFGPTIFTGPVPPPPNVAVPNVVGLTQTHATNAIQTAGLVAAVTTQSSTTVPVGQVMSQNPAASTLVGPGSIVHFVVSSGVTVPAVVGQTQGAATTTLQNAGLTVTSATQPSTTVPLGNVISQSPIAGAQVNGGVAVHLIVSAGTTVPAVVGQTQALATSAIQSAGLVASVTTQSSATVPAGVVISQSPGGGTTASAGATVNLVVSAGVTVPNVVGQTQSAATTTLQGAGYVVTSSTLPSATVPAGSVISQNPAAGTNAAPGATVALVVSSGPPPTITLANLLSAQATTSSTFIDLAYTVPTLAGQQLVLSVQAGAEASSTNLALPASATFNGRTLTRAGAIRSTATGSNVGAGIFWLPVTAGESGTIRVTFTGTCQQRGVTAVTLAGAAATGPTVTEIAAGTATLTDQITTTGVNTMVISTATQSNTGNLTATGTGHIRDASLALSASRMVSGHAEAATPTTLTLGYSGTITRVAMVLAAYPFGAPPPPPITVPNVVNLAQAAAESALLTAGLQTGAITTAFHPSVPAGHVISQNPLAGTAVASGTSVQLVVSLGAEPPTVAPTVALTAPANNATFITPANVALTATASDSDGTITRVEFFNGATKLGEDTTAPYAFTWTNAPLGNHSLTARATDNDNATTNSAPIAIVVEAPNVVPTVALTAPTNNATFTTPVDVTLTATASDTDGTITRVEFFNGATKLGEDTSSPYAFTWTNAPLGGHSLTARATDDDNATTNSAPVAITVDGPPNVPPTVALTAPAGGATFTAPATVALTADASDTDGSIARVEFFAGATKLGEDTTAPYAFTWTNAPAGAHSLTAVATDSSTATTTSAPVAITINPPPNVPPTAALTAPADGTVFPAGASVALTATATDIDGTVTLVEFFQGATKLGEDATSPYAFTWTNVSAGNYTLTARATDNASGVTTSAPVAIIVNAAPTVALTAPAHNATFTAPVDVALTATASDTDGTITRVDFFNGATKLGEDTTAPYAFTWLAAPTGTHSLTARATDNRGALTTSSAATITIAPAAGADSDDDGLPDDYETANGLNPNDPLDGDLDLDGDLIGNRLEYALATAANAPNRAGLPTLGTSGSQLTLTFLRAREELTYIVQASDNNKTWTDLATNPGAVGNLVTVTDPNTASSNRYLRLRATDGVSSVTTIPAGRVRLSIPQNQQYAFGFPLHRALGPIGGRPAGFITAVGASTLDSTGAGWTAGQLSQAAAPTLLRLTSGAARGRLFPVSTTTANTATRLTLVTNGADLTSLGIIVGTDTFELVPGDTLATRFPTGTLQSGTVSTGDNLVRWTGTATVLFYHDGANWQQLGGGVANNQLIRPDEGWVLIRRGAALTYTQVGHAPATDATAMIVRGNASFISLLPVETTFAELALHTQLPGWASNPSNPTSGDYVQSWDSVIYYFDGTVWRQQGGADASNMLVNQTGRSIAITRPTGTGSNVLRQVKPY